MSVCFAYGKGVTSSLLFFQASQVAEAAKGRSLPVLLVIRSKKKPIALDTQTPNKCLFLRRYQTRAWCQQKRQENICETLDLIKSLWRGVWYEVYMVTDKVQIGTNFSPPPFSRSNLILIRPVARCAKFAPHINSQKYRYK